MKKHTTRLGLALLAAAALLAACGGGGGDDCCIATNPGNGSQVPSSALQDSNGLVAYLKDLINNHTDDSSEPVALGSVELPVSNVIEPVSISQ